MLRCTASSQVCSARCYCRTSITTLLHSQPFTHSTSRDPGWVLPVVDHVRFEHRPESHHAQPRRYSALFTTYLLSGLIDSTAGFPHARSPDRSSGCSCAQPAQVCSATQVFLAKTVSLLRCLDSFHSSLRRSYLETMCMIMLGDTVTSSMLIVDWSSS